MKDVRVDKLNKAYLEHGMISEEVTFFKKFVEGINADEVENYLTRLREFSEEHIVEHFLFEEEDVFPLILKYGNKQEKKIVQILLDEHVTILKKLEEVLEKITSYGTHLTEQEVADIMLSTREFLEMVLVHARKEDAHFFQAVQATTPH
jgi:DUF438 domain-containing protein